MYNKFPLGYSKPDQSIAFAVPDTLYASSSYITHRVKWCFSQRRNLSLFCFVEGNVDYLLAYLISELTVVGRVLKSLHDVL